MPKDVENAEDKIVDKQDLCVFWMLKDLPGKDNDKKVSADNVKQVMNYALRMGANRALMIVREVTA